MKDYGTKSCITCKKEFALSRTNKNTKRFCSISCSRVNPESNKKTRETKLKKYGSETWNNSEKRKETTFNKYGIISSFSLPETREKSKQTMMERYGVEHNSTARKIQLDKDKCYNLYNNDNLSCSEIGTIVGLKRTAVERKFREFEIPLNKGKTQSSHERIIRDYLTSLKIEYICNSRNIISPKELDIFIPSHNLAIEINGLYWHSDERLDKNYHYNKMIMCKEKNIQLLQFFDFEIKEKLDIVKSIISSYFNKNERIYGRKCEIFIPSKKETYDFINENHIQGNVRHSYSIGLKYNNIIVGMMTFGVPRFNKNYDFELLRLCFKIGFSVLGGTEKMFKYFIDNHVNKSIISYCDNRLFGGNVYSRIGMNHVKDSSPSYIYSNNQIRLSRYQCQKHKLSKILEKFNPDFTEIENMKNNGFFRTWDAGTSVFTITTKENNNEE